MADVVYEELRELMLNTKNLIGSIPSEREGDRKQLFSDLFAAVKAHLENRQKVTMEMLDVFTVRFEMLTRPEELPVVEAPAREEELGGKVYRKAEEEAEARQGTIPGLSREDLALVLGGIPPMGRFTANRSDEGRTFMHRAVDIYSEEGTLLYPPTVGVGVVVYAGDAGGKAGLMVNVMGQDNFGRVVIASYVHCSKLFKRIGDEVKGWGVVTVPEKIAAVGRTGNAADTGPHVHFMLASGIRITEGGVARDVSGNDLSEFFKELSLMGERERRNYLREHPISFSSNPAHRLNPETELRRGSVGVPMQEFEKVSAKHCLWPTQQKGIPLPAY